MIAHVIIDGLMYGWNFFIENILERNVDQSPVHGVLRRRVGSQESEVRSRD